MKTDKKDCFGKYVFDDRTLKNYLPSKKYKEYLKIKEKGEELPADVASFIAKAIKKWASELGATHYCHWFLPLTSKTAEKQVSFIEVNSKGDVIEDFNEKSLIKGETDASSFPNGGERMTFEARGYTIWDYTSPVFIKEDLNKNKVVYIPTAFCTYNGVALDEKTPLLRALEKLNIEAKRVLSCLGYNDVKKVLCNVGAEQEYFLIKKEDYDKRLDLKLTERTLLGKSPAKSQEISSHYFGAIDDEISKIMHEVDKTLWSMGITAKIQHNEVAPMQFELVPIYSQSNIASDQNQIIMETVSKVAKKYGFVCLFHEKPFSCINGSGKHINLSISTDSGLNLLDANMEDKTLFLVFFSSMIVAVDRYYKLIRASTAYRGNDLRLGGEEAPPALISVFIGEYLEKLVCGEEFSKREDLEKLLDTGVKSLPKTIKDYCDRNRTSPFAYCGSKFEFRMVGSSQSIALPITCICTAYQEVLKEIADELEKSSESKRKDALKIIKESILKHKRIIFNGNGYEESWKEKAKRRNLVELRDCVSAYAVLDDADIKELFSTSGVLTENELSLRKNALLKRYIESVEVEAKTLNIMLNKEIYPSCTKTINFYYLDTATKYASECAKNIITANNSIYAHHKELNKYLEKTDFISLDEKAKFYCDKVASTINAIRADFDSIEDLIPDMFKPFPTYNDILFKF